MNLNDDKLEKALREALQRTAPPPDFAAKVLARTQQQAPIPFPKPVVAKSRRPMLLALAAAVAAIAIIPAALVERQRMEAEHQRMEEARGLKAKRDLLTALAITRDQLQQAKEKVRRSTRNIQ